LLTFTHPQGEAFSIWSEWASFYPPRSEERQLLENVRDKRWLVSLLHHDFQDRNALWNFLDDSVVVCPVVDISLEQSARVTAFVAAPNTIKMYIIIVMYTPVFQREAIADHHILEEYQHICVKSMTIQNT